MCGTPNYISPEVASRSSHGLEVDVWGLGCMLYTLLVGKPPFDTSEVKSTLTRVVMAKYELPSYLSVEAKDLIDSLLKKNPKERIKLDQILDHPFLKLYSKTGATTSRLSQDSGVHTMSIKRDSVRTSVSSDCGPRRLNHNEVRTRRINSDCSPVRHPNLAEKFESNPFMHNRRSRSQERCHKHEPQVDKYEQFNNYQVKKCSENDDIQDYLYNLGINDRREDHHKKEISERKPEQISLFSQNSMCDRRSNLDTNNGCFDRNDKYKCQHSCCSQKCKKAQEVIETNRSVNVLDDLRPPVNKFPLSEITSDIQQQGNKQNRELDSNDNLLIGKMSPKINVPQLCSFRLLPTRHRAKNAILSILDSGEVCVEIIKKRNSTKEEIVKEVCLISPDGMRIVIFEPDKGRGVRPMDKPPPLPQQGADSIYSYENLPEKHWKKYMYAARFVDLVRAKTPKVTYYSPKTKFQLMENLMDYEANFYEGKSLLIYFYFNSTWAFSLHQIR